MTRISFLNGDFIAHEQAYIHIEDRGMQFADGIYEVILFHQGKLIDGDWHLERLFDSLHEIQLAISYNQQQLTDLIQQLFKQNNLASGSLYLQITRGVNPRNQLLPTNYTPTIIATVSPLKELSAPETVSGIKVMTTPDMRWSHCNIKSIGLLASAMARQQAADLGYADAILIRDNYVSECTFANVFIVDQSDRLLTRAPDNFILNGITRRRIIQLARDAGMVVSETKFTPTELINAKEVFSSSTTLLISPIVAIDGRAIADGLPGKLTKKLSILYQAFLNS